MTELETKRKKAAEWYKKQASASDSGEVYQMFRTYAARIMDGLADHRIDTVLEHQSQFGEGARLNAHGSPDAHQPCSWCETQMTRRSASKGHARCPVCHTEELLR